MSIIAYANCTIHIRPQDRDLNAEYSDRSFVELCLEHPGFYVLRGIDVQNNKKEIFKIPLTHRGIYEFGYSHNLPDEVHYNNTIYRLYLKQDAYAKFHEELKKCFDQMDPSTRQSSEGRTITDGNGILLDIHQLAESIGNGDATNAEQLARKLTLKRVQLKEKTVDGDLHDKILHIRIRIDFIDPSNNQLNKGEQKLEVYSSTTVHELRVMFQYTHGFPFEHQYFFVNGHMAHAEWTMKDLAVQKDTLFVLLFTGKRE